MSSGSRNSDADFVGKLDLFLEGTRLDDGDVEALLRKEGVDATSALLRLQARVAEVEKELRAEYFAKVKSERLRALEGLASAPQKRRNREELIARLSEIRSQLPSNRQPQALFRGFETDSDEDLESMIDDLEALLPHGQ